MYTFCSKQCSVECGSECADKPDIPFILEKKGRFECDQQIYRPEPAEYSAGKMDKNCNEKKIESNLQVNEIRKSRQEEQFELRR